MRSLWYGLQDYKYRRFGSWYGLQNYKFRAFCSKQDVLTLLPRFFFLMMFGFYVYYATGAFLRLAQVDS